MLKSIRCLMKGHLFVDSRTVPGVQTCVRCRVRRPFEAMAPAAGSAPANDRHDDGRRIAV